VTGDEMRQRLAGARVARLATVGADGRPHLVPVCFALADDRLVSIVDAKPKTTTALRRLENVRANPHVSVLADEYDEDWSRLWWVRVDGRARVVDSGAEHEQAVRLLTRRYRQYRAAPPQGPVLVVDIERWRGWSPRS
jgi:PPOX class probable F420-dependent enzyme